MTKHWTWQNTGTWHKILFEPVSDEHIKHLCQCEPLEEHANTVWRYNLDEQLSLHSQHIVTQLSLNGSRMATVIIITLSVAMVA